MGAYGDGDAGCDGDGVRIDGSSYNVIRNNVISGNDGSGIHILADGSHAAHDNHVYGNVIGANLAGTESIPNGDAYNLEFGSGVFLDGRGTGQVTNNQIGGITPAERNLISGNNRSGVQIQGPQATANVVRGNYIGTNLAGTAPLDRRGNLTAGVEIRDASGNIIGGYTHAERNLISGNNTYGVYLRGEETTGNRIVGNWIGVDATGEGDVGNRSDGIFLFDARNTRIGGVEPGAGNIIAYNGDPTFHPEGSGVTISFGGTGNAILGNSIFANQFLGIDLNEDGITQNDAGDGDMGPNNLQNYPELRLLSDGQGTRIRALLDSTPLTKFRIEVYSNSTLSAAGHLQGEQFVRAFEVVTDFEGQAILDLSTDISGLTVTATDEHGNTSEFSPLAILVNATGDESDADSNDGVPDVDLGTPGLQTTLRAAIEFANLRDGRDVVRFDIPGESVPTIQPQQPLPTITDALFLDGTSQPRSGQVAIDGNAAGGGNGLTAAGADLTLSGLQIAGFQGAGISSSYATGADGLLVLRGPLTVSGNAGDGVSHSGTGNMLIVTGSVDISNNGGWGISHDMNGSMPSFVVSGSLSVTANGAADPSAGGIYTANSLLSVQSMGATLDVCDNDGPGIRNTDTNDMLLGNVTVSRNQGIGIAGAGYVSVGNGEVSDNDGTGILGASVAVSNMEVTGNGGYGIETTSLSAELGVGLVDSRINANSLGGVLSRTSIRMSEASTGRSQVSDNLGHGIEVHGGSLNNLANVDVLRNRGHGIWSHAGPLFASGLSVSENQGSGILMEGGSTASLAGTRFTVADNTGDGINVSGDLTLSNSRIEGSGGTDLIVGGVADLTDVYVGDGSGPPAGAPATSLAAAPGSEDESQFDPEAPVMLAGEPLAAQQLSEPAATFLDRMLFTDMIFQAHGVGTIDTATDEILDDRFVYVGLGSRNDAFDVNDAVDIVTLNDLSYGFVTGYNRYIRYWASRDPDHEPAANSPPFYPEFVGANVGIIRDPFGANPDMVTGTNSYFMGFPHKLALSQNENLLYVGFRGSFGVMVYDIPKLIARLEAASDPQKFEEWPIDLAFPHDDDPGVLLGTIGVAGIPIDFAVQRVLTPVGDQLPDLAAADLTTSPLELNQQATVGYDVTLHNAGLLTGRAWSEEIWLTDDGVVDGTGYEQRLSQRDYVQAGTRSVQVTMPRLAAADQPSLGQIKLETVRGGLSLVTIVNAGRTAIDREPGNDIVVMDATIAGPDLVVMDLKRVPVLFDEELAELTYLVLNDSDIGVPAGTAWREQVWIGTDLDVFAPDDPGQGRWSHQVSTTVYTGPLAGHSWTTRRVTPDLRGVTLPEGVNSSSLNWIVLVDFPSDADAGAADPGVVIESHEVATGSGAVVGNAVGSATRALNSNNSLLQPTQTIDFDPLQIDVLEGEFIRDEASGTLELSNGKVQIGLKPLTGRPFVPLLEVTGDVSATLNEVTVQGDVWLLEGDQAPLYRGTFKFPLGGRAGVVQESGEMPDDFMLGGCELLVSGLEFALPDKQFPDGRLLVHGILTLPDDLGGVDVALPADRAVMFSPGAIAMDGFAGKAPNHQFTLGGLDVAVQSFQLSYKDQFAEMRMGGQFHLPQFGATVQVDAGAGDYFQMYDTLGVPEVEFWGSMNIGQLPIGGGFKLLDTDLTLSQDAAGWQAAGTSVLAAPREGRLNAAFDVRPNGEISFAVQTVAGKDFYIFGIGADATDLTLVSDRQPGDAVLWDPQITFAGSLFLPADAAGPEEEILSLDGPEVLAFYVPANAPLLINRDGVLLPSGSSNIAGRYSLRLFDIAMVEIENPALSFNTAGKWAEFRTNVTFPQLDDAAFDFTDWRFVRIADGGMSVQDRVDIPGPVNITDAGTFHLSDLLLEVVPGDGYYGPALLHLPDRVLNVDVQITREGTRLDLQTAGAADLTLAGLPFDLTGAELNADRDPAAGPDWDPELRLEGRLPLPEEFGGLMVRADADHPLLIGRDGLSVSSGGLALPPDVSFTLFGQLELQTTADSRFALDLDQDRGMLLGTFVIPSLGDLAFEFGDASFATMQQTENGPVFAAGINAGAASIPVFGGFSLDDVQVNLAKAVGDGSATLAGSARLVVPGGASQTFDLVFIDGAAAPVVVTAENGLDFALQGVDVRVAQFGFTPDRAVGDSRIWDPQISLTGSLTLPPGLGGQTLPLQPPDALVVTSEDRSLAGGGLPVPGDFTLPGPLDVDPVDLRLNWVRNPAAWTIQGGLTLPGVFGATAGLTGASRIEVTGNAGEPAQVNLAGEIRIDDVVLEPGLFHLTNGRLTRDAGSGQVAGTALLAVPPGLMLDATLRIRDGGLDRIRVDAEGRNLPVGATGTVLHGFEGSLLHFADADPEPVVLSGSTAISGGPEVLVTLPAFAPGELEGPLFAFDGTATVDGGRLAGSGQIRLAAGVGAGAGSVDLNWMDGTLSGAGTFDLLDGLIALDGSFVTNAAFGLSLGGPARVELPRIAFSPLDGRTLEPATGLFQFSPDGDLANDFVAGYGVVDTFLGPLTLGIRVRLDGSYELIHSETELPATTGGTGGPAVFDLDAGHGRLLLRAFWENESPGALLRLTLPDGTTLDETDFEADPDIGVVEPFSSLTSRTVGLRNPQPGQYTLALVNAAGLGQTQLRAYVDSAAPQLTINGPAADTPDRTVVFEAVDADSAAVVSLYLDKDQAGFDGVPVAWNIAEEDGTATVAVDTSGLAAGSYFVYGIIDDGQNAPVRSDYSAGRIVVDAPSATISGSVFDDLNANGLRDAGEPGVGGRTVFLDWNGDGSSDGEPVETSADDGSYSFTVAQGAVYRVGQIVPAGAAATTGTTQTVRIGLGEDSVVAQHGTYEYARIRGATYDDRTGDMLPTSGEPPLVGVTVYLDTDADGHLDADEPFAVSDENGRFAFDNLPPGTYHVAHVAPEGIVAYPPQTVTLVSGDDAWLALGSFRLGSVGGTVFLDGNSDGVRAASEAGIPGVLVFMDTNGNGTPDRHEPQTFTDDSGAYRFDGLAYGVYRIMHVPPEGYLTTVPPQPYLRTAHLRTSGKELTGLDFGDRPPGVVGGNFNGTAPQTAARLLAPADSLLAAPGDTPPPPGFTTTGNVEFDGGQATLHEAADVYTGLQTTFVVPGGAEELRFTIVQLDLNDNGGGLPDAFEAALLDPVSGAPLTTTAQGLSVTDALLNWQADGTVFFSPSVTVPGAAASGDASSGPFPVTVSIALTGLPAGTPASLRFDLLGFGGQNSIVVLDDILLVQANGLVPPVADDDAVATHEDIPLLIDVLRNDADPDGTLDPASVQVLTGPGHGTAVVNPVTGKVQYTPSENYFGPDGFTYEVRDNSGAAATAAVTIDVQSVNDDPEANDDGGQGFGTDEGTAFTTADALANDSDVDAGHVLTVTSIDTTGTTGLATNNGDGTFHYDPNGRFEYLADGETATDTFVYTLGDGQGGTDTAVVTVTVTGVNDGPTAGDDSGQVFEIDEDTAFTTGSVLANDADPDAGDTPTLQSIDATGTVGLLTDNGDGTFDYDPDGRFEHLTTGDTATVTFAYTIADNFGETDTAVVTITITGVNDAPVAADDPAETPQGEPVVIRVLDNDSDPDGTIDPSTLSIVTSPKHGDLFLSQTGAVTYSPDPDFAGADEFQYAVRDNQGGLSNTAGVQITVQGPQGATIRGRVFRDTDGAGPWLYGPGWAEFSVYLDADGDGAWTDGEPLTLTTDDNPATANVDETGFYSFAGLAAGSYTVRALPPVDASETYPGAPAYGHTVVLEQDGVAEGIDFGAVSATDTASISGYVYADVNNNGVRDAWEKGLADVPISLTGPMRLMVLTGPDGSYRFGQLPAGTYTVAEIQPYRWNDGLDTPGTPALGAVAQDAFEGLVLPGGTQAAEYNFGERGLKAQFVTKGDYLSEPAGGDPPASPDLVVRDQSGSDVPVGSTIYFGIVPLGQPAPQRSLFMWNTGTGTLYAGEVYLPPGFRVVDGLASTLEPAGSADRLTIEMDTSEPGQQYGVLGFNSNDADHTPYWVTVIGLVVETAGSYQSEAGGSGESPAISTLDVNGDMQVTPLDVLLVINCLNHYGPIQVLPNTAESAYDVNRDGWTTPLDVLLVVNHLNSPGPVQVLAAGAEGESASGQCAPAAPVAESAMDERPATLSATAPVFVPQPAIPVVIDRPAASNPATPLAAAGFWPDDTLLETELEDILSEIAPDLDEVWRNW